MAKSEAVEKEIIGLLLEIEDADTGAASEFHVLDSYYINKSGNFAQATFATYVSQRAFNAGRKAVSSNITIQLSALPPKGTNFEQLFYQAAAAPAEPDAINPSQLAGAELVYAD